MKKPEKQCVWIARYGLTAYQLVEGYGPFDSDIATPEGIIHAQSLAERLKGSEEGVEPKRIFASPFIRATHTAHIIARYLGLKVHVEDGIMEWLTPDLVGKEHYTARQPEELNKLYSTVDTKYRSVYGAQRLLMWENEKELFERAHDVINLLVDSAQGESILLCSHAPCAQALALALENVDLDPSKSKIPAWPLGGVTMFVRYLNEDGEYGDWNLEINCCTDHMPGSYRDGEKPWSLPGFENADQ
eukprot:CAMPEP_0116021564 /NCGR_PEP_ID=MMETSP0321-20121206/10464_1 /TAXON_ID=163516 /ORGANISM="Leptocylindrus danicus var. danicus, Strain B650" /LENGTH=244 /DNA_ID=CAMNT_0003492463 /DNA_START=92 /DNA_END=826 /DNA_ORIENTATION=+